MALAKLTNVHHATAPMLLCGLPCLDRHSATGKGSDQQTAKLRPGGEVVLSAGAINSPHIMQVSGIGPTALLDAHGVKPVVRAISA